MLAQAPYPQAGGLRADISPDSPDTSHRAFTDRLIGRNPTLLSRLEVPAAGFEPAALGLKELARLAVWPELGYPAGTEQKLISS